MTPTVKSIVYLPIEYRSREFDGKLALAVRLIQAGFVVVVGQQWGLTDSLKLLPTGIVLFKSQNRIHHGGMKAARQAGHMVVSLEEESLALTSELSIIRNCPPDTYGLVDYLLTTGEMEKQTHLRQGCDPNKLIVTGNPRVDILKPAFRPMFADAIDAIHARFGPYILINTNFGIKNSKWGSLEAVRKIEIAAGALNPNDPESVRVFEEITEFEEKNSQALFTMVEKLATSFPERTIILRPHPSEYLPKVAAQYSHLANVKVIHEGAHIPWTLGCDLLLHTSCTTGLEAAIAGKYAASLVTKENWTSRALLSNKINPVFSTVETIVENTRDVLEGRPSIAPRPLSAFEDNIRNIGDTLSIDLITQFLATLPRDDGRISVSPLPNLQRHEMQVQKCSISKGEMKAALKTLTQILGLPAEPSIHTLADSLFLLPPLHLAVKSKTAAAQAAP
jgi:surface carbohydrate biosynthesis protein